MIETYSLVILGTGIYGLYAATILSRDASNVLIIDCDAEPFGRGSYVNQARVHNGYHYPRSISTASKSADYFARFSKDFSYAINNKFKQVYALSKNFSFTNGGQFKKFCNYNGVPCSEIDAGQYFQPDTIDSAFETEEFAFDAFRIRDKLIADLKIRDNIRIIYSTKVISQENDGEYYFLQLNNGEIVKTPFVLNATYASVNQVLALFGFEAFKIKYEICEIALCKPNTRLDNLGFTVMDGPFFSVMPFGLDGTYSLTSVTFTPHKTSINALPVFSCQESNPNCTPEFLDNCNMCPARPQTAWGFMHQLARRYLKPEFEMEPTESLFAIKPILMASELDDSRPTVIREFNRKPRFVAVLSGKINTIYDLDEEL